MPATTDRRRTGFSIVELVVISAIVGVLAAAAVPSMLQWADDQRVKSAARSAADAMTFARSEAIRTGSSHLVVFGMALGATAPIVIVNDGPPTTANCQIDAGEVVHSVPAEDGVSWGTSTGGANGAAVPADPGDLPANAASGWTFADGSGANPASWLLYQPDGLPRAFTSSGGVCSAIGNSGEGGGGVYVTNGNRDYAVVLRPLGTVRVHKWDPGAGSWSN